ncbi:hypothetical protein EON65_27325 [archaeon]|nr:MAG: hypothetical protein EON65_27325 [archaeon]
MLGKEANLSTILTNLYVQVDGMTLPPLKKRELEEDIVKLNTTMGVIFTDINALVQRTDPGDLLLKTLLCNVPSGISPFFKMTPGPAWFGWLNDPIMTEVQHIIDILSAKIGKKIPWSTAIPGASINYTSIEDTRRRRTADTFKTGKKDTMEVSRYVRYQNMTHIWTCPEPYKAPLPYKEGEEFAACPHFQHDWDEKTARDMGYTKPFDTEFANRIQGTDGNMYGRPIRTEKIQIFISDIYRSVWLKQHGRQQWNGITLNRYGVQEKDMWNTTLNPDNAQYYAFGPTGLENATTANNVPVFISFPHFLHGDERLVSAVKGLHPQVGAHETYLSIEPQTGLLVEAKKRLQINYLMESYSLPEISPESVDAAEALCAGLQSLIEKIKDLPGVNETALPDVTCELTVITPLFTCLAQPSQWKLANDQIFFPFGWVAEEMALPDSDAEELKNTLFVMDGAAEELRFWSLIVAGACFGMLCMMGISMYYEKLHPQNKWQTFEKTQAPDTLGFTFNPSSQSYHPSTEPLLSKTGVTKGEPQSYSLIG